MDPPSNTESDAAIHASMSSPLLSDIPRSVYFATLFSKIWEDEARILDSQHTPPSIGDCQEILAKQGALRKLLLMCHEDLKGKYDAIRDEGVSTCSPVFYSAFSNHYLQFAITSAMALPKSKLLTSQSRHF